MVNLLVGADPELFLQHNGQFISAHNMIPGTKKDPFKVKNGAVQVDGMALEFNITPADDVKSWERNIFGVLAQMRKMIKPEYDMVLSATADFPEEYMKSLPEEARVLGCDPDYCAYTGERNPSPPNHPSMRTAAGHVHIGWVTEPIDPLSPEHFSACVSMAIQLDYALGLPAMLSDPDKRRQEMYGKPGAFRPKPYGMEYRTLSNYWLKDILQARNVYFNTVHAFRSLTGGKDYLKRDFENECLRTWKTTAREIIEKRDENTAKRVCDHLLISRR